MLYVGLRHVMLEKIGEGDAFTNGTLPTKITYKRKPKQIHTDSKLLGVINSVRSL